jgi:hypothetical protein
LLTKHRIVRVTAEEVGDVVALLASGGCVDDDAYLFPAGGGWVAYAGHDTGIILSLLRTPT